MKDVAHSPIPVSTLSGNEVWILSGCFLHRKFIGSLVVVIGVILVFVGFEGLIGYDGFTLVSCGGPEPRFCIRVYSLDLLALLVGVVAAFVGTRVLVRDR